MTPDPRSDATDRAFRTLIQGAVLAAVVAVLSLALPVITEAERLSAVDWGDLLDRAGAVAAVALGMAVLSFAQRLREG